MSQPAPYYELRLYQCVPGRIPDLHRRMTQDVLPMFAKHGVSLPTAYWTGYGGLRAPLYAYLLEWDSLDRRMMSFRNFYADPDWLRHREESNAGEQMVDRIDVFILKAESIVSDQLRPDRPEGVQRVQELRLQQIHARDPGAAMQAWRETDLPFLRHRGATELATFKMWYGTRLPQLVSLIGWDDARGRQEAFEAWDEDAAIAECRRQERSRFGSPLFGRCDVHLMQPEFKED
jgi:hypothetical protein